MRVSGVILVEAFLAPSIPNMNNALAFSAVVHAKRQL
jgi:hypothetical protein